MDENEINEKLRKTNNYLGTYSLDELSSLRISIYPSYLIINMDLRGNSGTHWIGMALYHQDVYLCDSLGTLIPDIRFPIELINFLHLVSFNKQLHISKQLQSYSSNLCGKYCVFFIFLMSLTNNYLTFLSYFSNKLDINDCIIILLYNTFINKNK